MIKFNHELEGTAEAFGLTEEFVESFGDRLAKRISEDNIGTLSMLGEEISKEMEGSEETTRAVILLTTQYIMDIVMRSQIESLEKYAKLGEQIHKLQGIR